MTAEQMLELRKAIAHRNDELFLNNLRELDIADVRWIATTNPHVSYTLCRTIDRLYQEQTNAH
jgi:hypothetical protein